MYFTENYIRNIEDIYYNRNKFESGEINLCWITGHSGSGKSTMGESMAREKIQHFDMDDLIKNYLFSDANLKEYGQLYYSFFNGVGRRFRYHSLEELNNDPKWDGTNMYNGYESHLIRVFVPYAQKFAKAHPRQKFICEGVWIYDFCKPEEFKDNAVYIKGTSALISKMRAIKRNIKFAKTKEEKRKALLHDISPERIKYVILSESKIMKFRKYFSDKIMNEEYEDLYELIDSYLKED